MLHRSQGGIRLRLVFSRYAYVLALVLLALNAVRFVDGRRARRGYWFLDGFGFGRGYGSRTSDTTSSSDAATSSDRTTTTARVPNRGKRNAPPPLRTETTTLLPERTETTTLLPERTRTATAESARAYRIPNDRINVQPVVTTAAPTTATATTTTTTTTTTAPPSSTQEPMPPLTTTTTMTTAAATTLAPAAVDRKPWLLKLLLSGVHWELVLNTRRAGVTESLPLDVLLELGIPAGRTTVQAVSLAPYTTRLRAVLEIADGYGMYEPTATTNVTLAAELLPLNGTQAVYAEATNRSHFQVLEIAHESGTALDGGSGGAGDVEAVLGDEDMSGCGVFCLVGIGLLGGVLLLILIVAVVYLIVRRRGTDGDDIVEAGIVVDGVPAAIARKQLHRQSKMSGMSRAKLAEQLAYLAELEEAERSKEKENKNTSSSTTVENPMTSPARFDLGAAYRMCTDAHEDYDTEEGEVDEEEEEEDQQAEESDRWSGPEEIVSPRVDIDEPAEAAFCIGTPRFDLPPPTPPAPRLGGGAAAPPPPPPPAAAAARKKRVRFLLPGSARALRGGRGGRSRSIVAPSHHRNATVSSDVL